MSCYHAGRDQPRMVRKRHDEDCPEARWRPPLVMVECDGCQECTEPHCLVQWHGERGDCETHAESVCPSCLGKVREHVEEIVRLSGLPLVAEVLTKGAASEAADLLGPAADPKQWRQRGDYGHRFDADSRVGWHTHPLSVLGWFDMIVTEHLGHSRTTRITITRAAGYLDRNLHFLAADIEFDFADMANTLADCRGHLERVLHDGEQVERGAPCLKCGTRVVRQLDKDGRVSYRCERCREDITDSGYLFAQKAQRLKDADRLTADDMAARTGVPAGTIRRWANVRNIEGIDYEPLFKSPSRNGMGHKVYRVSDVEAVRDSGGDKRGTATLDGASGTVSNEGAA
jgi:hypothetical protein